jgi:hypothetical protein
MQKASSQSTAWESVVDPRYCFNKLTLHARDREPEETTRLTSVNLDKDH